MHLQLAQNIYSSKQLLLALRVVYRPLDQQLNVLSMIIMITKQQYVSKFKYKTISLLSIIIMWTISEENLYKKYYIPIISRGFLVSALCYLIAFILPVLILTSIGYSWSDNSKVLLKPTIKYQNYQLFCLASDQSTIYSSSFLNQAQQNYQAIASVGTDQTSFSFYAFVPTTVFSCTLLTYNRIILNNNQILVTIPFSFYQQSSNSAIFLNRVAQKGKLQVYSNGPLLDTAVTFSQTNYVTASEFSMIQNSIEYSQRNLSAFVKVISQKKSINGSSTTEFEGSFQIQSQLLVKQQSLLNKIIQFVPFFIYLWFPIFFFLIVPLIQWMFQNKIYFSRTQNTKLKTQ